MAQQSEELRLRRGGVDDLPTIVAHNQAMALETEALELDPTPLTRGVRAALTDPDGRGFYLLAERQGQILGQLMVTREWSDWRDGFFWWIQSVYVLPAARRQGVFRALYRQVEREARQREDVCGLRLYVEAENRGAQACYAALGMQRTSYQLWEADFVLEEGRGDPG